MGKKKDTKMNFKNMISFGKYTKIITAVVLAGLVFASVYLFIQYYPSLRRSGAASDEFLQVSGRNFIYKGQTVQLRGSNVHNQVWDNNWHGSVNSIQLGEADYAKMAQMGGNHFRFGLAYGMWSDNKTSFFAALDKQIEWARKYNVWILLNLFTTPAHCYEGYSNKCGIWNSQSEQDQLVAFWVDIANRYKDEPAIIGYDVLNEPVPNSSTQWTQIVQRVRDAVWAVDQNHLIFNNLNDPGNLQRVNGNNVVYEVHDYSPLAFSHSSGGTSYPGTVSDWCGSFYWDYNAMKNGSSSCTNVALRFNVNHYIQNNLPLYSGEWGSRAVYSGYKQYIKDKGQVLNELGIHGAHYVWRHSQENWGLYPPQPGSALVPYDTELEQIIRNYFANAVRPNFGGGPPIVSSPGPTSGTGGNPTPVPTQPSGSSSPYKTLTIPGTIQGEDFDNGGQNVAYFDTTSGNTGGAYRSTDVDIKSISSGTIVGWMPQREWMRYTVNVSQSGLYRIDARGGTPLAGKQMGLEINGSQVATLNMPQTADWETYQEFTVGTVNLTAGQKTLVLRATTDSQDIDWVKFTLVSSGWTPAPTAVPTKTPSPTPKPTGNVTPAPTTTPKPGQPPAGGQPGWFAEYYNGANFESKVLSRIDSAIDFDWGEGSPANGVNNENFSVRWSAYFVPPVSGSYTFNAYTDDGARVWVDNNLVIDNWRQQAVTKSSGATVLQAGTAVSVVMEYNDVYQVAKAKLTVNFPAGGRQDTPDGGTGGGGNPTNPPSNPTPAPTTSPTNPPSNPTPVPTSVPSNGGLRVQNTSLVNQNGSRFIVEGVNIELYRDQGCSYITTGQIQSKTAVINKLKSLGVNAVRLNYYRSWLEQGSNINQYLDFAQTLAQNGIYVMPSDHAFTGQSLGGRSSSYPLFNSIVQGAKSRGFIQYLIMNPYNEPGPMGWSEWVSANKDTVNYLRNTAGFTGPIVLDGPSWAAAFDVSSFQQMVSYDASLRGGTANVLFSNHWYPNIPISNPQNASNSSNQVPVLIGELGQINPGSSGLDPSYVRNVLSNVVNTGIPRGFNGVFAWMWNWCDENSMTNNDFVTVNTYGNIYITDYFQKVQ